MSLDTLKTKVEQLIEKAQSGGAEPNSPPWIDTSTITDWSYWCTNNTRRDTLSSIDTSNGTNFDHFFHANTIDTDCPVDQIDTSKGTNFTCMFDTCSYTNIPAFNTSNGTNFSHMFSGCYNLKTAPQLDTSNGTNFSYTFSGCSGLTEIPAIDTSNGTNFSYMFNNCQSLTTVSQLNTSKGTSFTSMFNGCSKLTTIQKLDMSKGTNCINVFNKCTALTTIEEISFGAIGINIFSNCTSLTNITVTGTIKIKNNNLKLNNSNALTVDSIMSFINAFEDNTGGTRYTVYFGTTNLAKLTAEQIAIAENKNITLA